MDIIGHDHIQDYYTTIMERGALAHAYLFQGPSGVGKRALVEWLVGEVAGGKDTDAHPDVIRVRRLEDKKDISIKDIRELQRHISQTPFELSYKIAVIEDVEHLSVPAANALLKTLEEPAGTSLLVLTTSKSSAVIGTIQSRCQPIHLRPLPLAHLEKALNEQGVENAKELANMSHGLPQYALQLARDPELYADHAARAEEFVQLLTGTLAERLAYIESQFPKGKSLVENMRHASELVATWKQVVRDMLLLKYGLPDTITYVSMVAALGPLADVHPRVLMRFQRMVARVEVLLGQNANPRLTLENLLIHFSV